MATYESPSAAVIRRYTGVNGLMLDITESGLNADLTATVEDGEDEVFLRIGDSYRTSELSATQVRVLQRAVAHRTAAVVLMRVLTEKATGTEGPRFMEDSEAIRELIDDHERRAKQQETLLTSASSVDVAKKNFARPRFGSGTFSVTSEDRLPSDRNVLTDERDDVSSSDTENG
jgi:hypothetical protein